MRPGNVEQCAPISSPLPTISLFRHFHPGRLTAGFHHHGGLVQIIFLSIHGWWLWVPAVHLPECSRKKKSGSISSKAVSASRFAIPDAHQQQCCFTSTKTGCVSATASVFLQKAIANSKNVFSFDSSCSTKNTLESVSRRPFLKKYASNSNSSWPLSRGEKKT